MARKQSTGRCQFCHKLYTRGGLGRHLKSCKARQAANLAAKGKTQTLYHLRIQSLDDAKFWMNLEVCGEVELSALDSYLRDIWLERPDHRSQFILYEWEDGVAIPTNAGAIFSRVDRLLHHYNFGLISDAWVQIVSKRDGVPLSEHPIYLMARNDMSGCLCQVCDESAEYVCPNCFYRTAASGYLCAKHTADHPHDDACDGFYKLHNSPRVGLYSKIV
ncbi:MAG: hypothetical protein ACPG8W_10145 [Candidatus Promineifilaceae bacterium]